MVTMRRMQMQLRRRDSIEAAGGHDADGATGNVSLSLSLPLRENERIFASSGDNGMMSQLCE